MSALHTSFSYSPADDQDIERILERLGSRERSAYIRAAIRFYEANKDRLAVETIASRLESLDQVLALLGVIDQKLTNGIPVVPPETLGEDDYLAGVINQLGEFD
ncbi:MAG: hypothetical protein ACREIQ_02935 [Nitrospiria bacterium]